MSRVAEIKRQVDDGTYKVDPRAVAEAMLDATAGRKNPNEERHCEVRALDYTGVPHREIAAKTGFGPTAVAQILQRHHRPALSGTRPIWKCL